MDLTYYTIDNLRAQWEGENWMLARHPTLAEAVAAYQSLPDTKVRALGASIDLRYEIDLVHCRPIQRGEEHGENLLVVDYLKIERWRTAPEVLALVETLKEDLHISRMFSGREILDLPAVWHPSPAFGDKYLDPLRSDNLKSAINEIYVHGEGWLTPERYMELFPSDGSSPHFPYVDRYNIRYVTTTGAMGQSDVSPVDLHHLTEKTKEFLRARAAARESRAHKKYEEVR